MTVLCFRGDLTLDPLLQDLTLESVPVTLSKADLQAALAPLTALTSLALSCEGLKWEADAFSSYYFLRRTMRRCVKSLRYGVLAFDVCLKCDEADNHRQKTDLDGVLHSEMLFMTARYTAIAVSAGVLEKLHVDQRRDSGKFGAAQRHASAVAASTWPGCLPVANL